MRLPIGRAFDIIRNMKTNDELRKMAWERIWKGRWFGRLLGGTILLGVCSRAILVVIAGILGRFGVISWIDYLQLMARSQADPVVPMPVIDQRFVISATAATASDLFIGYIMAGIVAFGSAVILQRCLRDDVEGWLGAAFAGFRRPFDMLWLFVRMVVIFLGWGLLGLLPLGLSVAAVVWFDKHEFFASALLLQSVVFSVLVVIPLVVTILVFAIPFYRYRFLWLVKADHPDWGAGECIRACRELMDGHKRESFRLDCSYWRPFTCTFLAFLVPMLAVPACAFARDTIALALLFGLVALLSLVVGFFGVLVLGQYVGVGQGFFYEELKQNNERKQ